MAFKTLSAKAAAALDKELMSSGAFSLDQLMELAGLAVSQAVYRVHPPSKGRRILIACGPGNNGGDGLVTARHLTHFGYNPTIYYPKQGKIELYERLVTQLKNLDLPFTDDFTKAAADTDHILDAVFGFSFSGEVREPFPAVIEAMKNSRVPVTSVDVPSSWDVDDGPASSGPGEGFNPANLVSLTTPKPCSTKFKGRHFVGGRFLSSAMAKKYDVELPAFDGVDQIVELSQPGKL